MRFADVDIRAALAADRLRIDPLPKDWEIGAVSVDLQLGTTFRVFSPGKAAFVELSAPINQDDVQVTDLDWLMEVIELGHREVFYLYPGGFALGITHQCITLPSDIAGRLDGRSSLARVGLMVHATAHTIDPGWNGHITLELFNCGQLPLALRTGMRICALSFESLLSPTSKPYAAQPQAKYKDQNSPLPSRFRYEQ